MLLLHYYPEEVLKLRPLLGLSAPCMHGALEGRTGNHEAQHAVVKFELRSARRLLLYAGVAERDIL